MKTNTTTKVFYSHHVIRLGYNLQQQQRLFFYAVMREKKKHEFGKHGIGRVHKSETRIQKTQDMD